MSGEIGYIHTYRFRWKEHWFKWRQVWCHYFGHKAITTNANLSYFAKINGTEWRRVKENCDVLKCSFCNVVLSFDVRIKADRVEKQVAHLQVYEPISGEVL